MHDLRDRVRVESATDGIEVGHIALHEDDARALVRRQDEIEPVRPIPEVVADRLVAVVQHGLQAPRAEAAERAGDEDALAHQSPTLPSA